MHKYRISGVPIVNPAGKLVGIITNRDMRFLTDHQMKIADVMTKDNLVTAPVGTTLPEAQAAFDRRDKKRMAALFVTRGGGKDGALLGMITPWDVLRQK